MNTNLFIPSCITKDQAIALLPDGNTINTLRNITDVTVESCDYTRQAMLDLLDAKQPIITGQDSLARSLGYGLVIIDEQGPLFIETRLKAQ